MKLKIRIKMMMKKFLILIALILMQFVGKAQSSEEIVSAAQDFFAGQLEREISKASEKLRQEGLNIFDNLDKTGKFKSILKLLEETVDLNRLIKELHRCVTVDRYLITKKAIAEATQTITLPVVPRIAVAKFMDDYYTDLANSYCKATANTIHYVKVYDEAIEVIVEVKNKVVDICIRVVIEDLKNYIHENNEENEN